ncbi:MAG: PepSY-associated TM helix domain-containing protein [Puniceicoccaceae bacterium]
MASISKPKRNKWRSTWTKQLYLWHWVSSAICLVAMVLFAFTGITLNHAGSIPAQLTKVELRETLPAALMSSIEWDGESASMDAPLPKELRRYLERNIDMRLHHRVAEWSEYEIYLALPQPGSDAWLTIDRETGEWEFAKTKRGWIAYLNDLHKGRNTGPAWSVFIDVFSVACVVFCLTGLLLLAMHAKRRPSTWPVVAAGVVIPAVLLLFFVH